MGPRPPLRPALCGSIGSAGSRAIIEPSIGFDPFFFLTFLFWAGECHPIYTRAAAALRPVNGSPPSRRNGSPAPYHTTPLLSPYELSHPNSTELSRAHHSGPLADQVSSSSSLFCVSPTSPWLPIRGGARTASFGGGSGVVTHRPGQPAGSHKHYLLPPPSHNIPHLDLKN